MSYDDALAKATYELPSRNLQEQRDWAVNRVGKLECELERARAVVEAWRAYATHGHPFGTGACSTDHFTDVVCDCGWRAVEEAVLVLDAWTGNGLG